MIYYAIKMIYYAIKWFTIQLFDFVNNLLVPVEIFNRYQSGLTKKRWCAGVERRPRGTEWFGVPLSYSQFIDSWAPVIRLKYKISIAFGTGFGLPISALCTFQFPPVVGLRYWVDLSPGVYGLP